MSLSPDIEVYEDFVDAVDHDIKETVPEPVRKELWRFHKWMRQETDLSSGTIVDYLKEVAQEIEDSDGVHRPVIPADSENTSALKKFDEFREKTNFTSETGTEGEE